RTASTSEGARRARTSPRRRQASAISRSTPLSPMIFNTSSTVASAAAASPAPRRQFGLRHEQMRERRRVAVMGLPQSGDGFAELMDVGSVAFDAQLRPQPEHVADDHVNGHGVLRRELAQGGGFALD